jgi:hypothetical protein
MAVGLILLVAGMTSAAIPKKIAYQGRLTDASGAPLAGEHDLFFSLHNAESGGIMLWSEAKTETADSNGVFSTILGSTTPIQISFEEPRWLAITVDGEPLAPRREIVSVASAFNAQNADSLGGVASGSYSLVGHTHDDRYYTETELNTTDSINNASNPVDWTKLKSVPAGFADGTDAVGAGDGYSLDAADGSPTDAVYVGDDGKVGVGTTSPEAPMHIYAGSAGAVTAQPAAELVLEDDHTVTINFLCPPGSYSEGLQFGDADDSAMGWIMYDHINDKLRLATNNADRVTILNDGNVGIGTATPGYPLDVQNASSDAATRAISAVATSTGTGQQVTAIVGETRTTAATNAGSGVLGLASSTTGTAAGTKGESASETGTGVLGWAYHDSGVNYGVVGLTDSPNGYAGYFQGGKNYFQNKVGIGTTSPAGRLHIYGTDIPLLLLDSPSPTQTEMSFATGGTKKWTWYIPAAGSNFSLWHVPSPTQNYLTFNGTNGDIHLAPSTGNVGIGTTTPEAKLDVVGEATVTGSDSDWSVVEGKNTHTTGTGISGIGNNVTGYVLAAGSGVAGTG